MTGSAVYQRLQDREFQKPRCQAVFVERLTGSAAGKGGQPVRMSGQHGGRHQLEGLYHRELVKVLAAQCAVCVRFPAGRATSLVCF